MTLIGVLIALCLQILLVENVMISLRLHPDTEESLEENIDDGNHDENSSTDMELKDPQKTTLRDNDYEGGKNYYDNPFINTELMDIQNTTPPNNDDEIGSTVPEIINKKNRDSRKSKACSEIMTSDSKNSPLQSLLRKYRYDSNGVLIPNSVKYYIKMPQGFGSTPILVPLMNKAYSPLGGFVRYYKEVPPIPPYL